MFLLKPRIILLAAEVLAVAVLHLTFALRRDRPLPQGSKVPWIRGIPVFKNFSKKLERPAKQPFSIGTWTPPTGRSKMIDPDA